MKSSAAISRSPVRDAFTRRAITESVVVVAIIGWWLTSMQMPATVFPGPLEVLAELGRLVVEREFWTNVAITGLRVFAAVAIATLLGTALGLLPRYVKWTRGVVDD